MARVPKKIEIITEAKGGKLTQNRELIAEAVNAYEGKQIKLTLALCYKQRTSKENRYYWGVLIEHWKNLIREEWGEIWNKDDVHHFLKSNLNFEELVDDDTGLVLRKPKSTKDNSTYQQEEYHKAIRDLAWNMFQYQIPLPNEKLNAEFS